MPRRPKQSTSRFTSTTLHPGLAIYLQDRSPFYYARIWDAANKRYIVKSTETESKIDAKKIALAHWHTLHTGGSISRTPRDKTFKFWCRQFLNAQFEKVKKGTYQKRPHDNEVSLLFGPDTGIVKFLGTKEVGKVRPKDVQDYFSKRNAARDTELTPSTRNKYLNIVKKVLKHAYEEDVIGAVPEFKTERSGSGDRPRPSFRFAPVVPKADDEYQQLLDALRQARDEGVTVRGAVITQELYDFVVFLVHSFCRPTLSEVFSIRQKDVTIREDLNCLQIEIAKGKTGYRMVSTTPQAIEIYERIRARHDASDDDYLFLPDYPNRNHARRILANQFNEVLSRAGLKQDAYGVRKPNPAASSVMSFFEIDHFPDDLIVKL